MPNHHLLTKLCIACGREFAWRKKWERDWDRVKYCSHRCARAGPAPAADLRSDGGGPVYSRPRRS